MAKNAQARRLFQNFGFLTLGKTLGDAFVFSLFVSLSRAFGQEGIGQYSFGMAFTGFFVIAADFGLTLFTMREVSRCSDQLQDYYGRILSLMLVLSVTFFALLLAVVPFLPFSGEFKTVIVMIGAYTMMARLVEGISALFIAREETHYAGLLEVSLRGVSAVAGITIVMMDGSLLSALATLPVVAAGHVLVAYGLATWKYGRPRVNGSVSSLISLAREAWPFAQSMLLFQLYSRIDVVFLGLFLGAAAAGVYNVAYRVVFLLAFIPYFASVALFPQASRMHERSSSELEPFYQQALRASILMGLPIAAGLWLIAPKLIALVFGTEFDESAQLLRFLAGILFIAFPSRIIVVFMMSSDLEGKVVRSQWVAALVNIAGNLILIPTLGIKGAAIATLTSEALLVLLMALQLRPVLGWPSIGSRLVIGSVGVAAFCIPFTVFPGVPLFVLVPASILVYLLILLIFPQTRRCEIQAIVGILKRDQGIATEAVR